MIGIVGRIVPIKNHRLFFEAARSIADRCADARFVVVGDGVLRQEIEAHANSLGLTPRTVFTGWRRDLPEIYADLDVLVLASLSEGTPVAAIEAMASRCPVVATRVGGVPDLIEDGVTGLLVESGDATGLADAVITALQDPYLVGRLAEAARARVRVDFNEDRLVMDTARLYWRLLHRKGLATAPSRAQAGSMVEHMRR